MYVYLKVESFFEKKNLKADKMHFKMAFLAFYPVLPFSLVFP
jgi:hypothetical protein